MAYCKEHGRIYDDSKSGCNKCGAHEHNWKRDNMKKNSYVIPGHWDVCTICGKTRFVYEANTKKNKK